jgi:hypothetical protein
MNREELIRMAREADQYADDHAPAWTQTPQEWQELRDHRFATLVAAAEREACAKVCDEFAAHYWAKDDAVESVIYEECAAAIRARSNNV